MGLSFHRSGHTIPGNPREQHQPGLPPAPGDGEAVRLDDAKVGLDVVGGGAAAEGVGEGVEALELPVRESPQLRVQQGRTELPRPGFFLKNAINLKKPKKVVVMKREYSKFPLQKKSNLSAIETRKDTENKICSHFK